MDGREIGLLRDLRRVTLACSPRRSTTRPSSSTRPVGVAMPVAGRAQGQDGRMHNHAPPGYECFVCNVVAGDTGDSVVITENELALAIVSRRVWAKGPGHALVVPKAHCENLYDLDDPAGLDIHRLTRRIAIGLKAAFACDGTSTRQHNEPAGNQDLWHLHVHVFPRYDGDDLYGAGYRESTYEERLDFASRLQAAL